MNFIQKNRFFFFLVQCLIFCRHKISLTIQIEILKISPVSSTCNYSGVIRGTPYTLYSKVIKLQPKGSKTSPYSNWMALLETYCSYYKNLQISRFTDYQLLASKQSFCSASLHVCLSLPSIILSPSNFCSPRQTTPSF